MPEIHRVLITGIDGFLGASLSRAVREAGYDVWGIDLAEDSANQVVRADLLDPAATREAIAALPEFEMVIHAAAMAHGQRLPKGETYTTINTRMTDNVIRSLEGRQPRIIFFSSVAVYGEYGRCDPVTVHDDLRPSTDYGRSKVQCEKRILSSELEECDILRLAPVFDKDHMKDVRKRVFLPGLSFVKFRFFPPPQYSFCSLETVIQAVLDVLSSPPRGCRIHNVTDAKPYDQHEVASWFEGKSLPLPIAVTKPLYWLIQLLPSKRKYALQCLYWKLLRSNVCSPGVISVTHR